MNYRKETIAFICGMLALIGALIVIAIASGCITVEPLTAEQGAYIAAKTAMYGTWRCDGIMLADLQKAKPHVEALYEALQSATETELNETLSVYVAKWEQALPLASDRELVSELTALALAQVRLRDPALLESRDIEIARAVVGGILDGIALAEHGALE